MSQSCVEYEIESCGVTSFLFFLFFASVKRAQKVKLIPPLRASDDLEKTNTTYAEDSQPTQGENCVFIESVYPTILVRGRHQLHYFTPSACPWLFVTQRSPFIWMNQTLSQRQAVTMESQNASSPPGPPAAESPSMNLHFTNRRRRLRTKHAGNDLNERIFH